MSNGSERKLYNPYLKSCTVRIIGIAWETCIRVVRHLRCSLARFGALNLYVPSKQDTGIALGCHRQVADALRSQSEF